MKMLNNLEVNIDRYDDSTLVRSVQIIGGEPDACGHRFEVAVDRQSNGTYLVQTNFSDVFESHTRFEVAMGYAMQIALHIDEHGTRPEVEEEEA